MSDIILHVNRYLFVNRLIPGSRKIKRKSRPFFIAPDIDITAVILHCVPDHRQPQSGSAPAHHLFGVKRFEYTLQIIR